MVDDITTEEFDDIVANSTNPVFVDFWATWCGPCRALSPIVEELSDEIDGIDFYKCDADENQDIAMRYGIMSVPTLMVFKDGEAVWTNVGSVPKGKLKTELEALL